MARLRRVRRRDELYRNACFLGLVLDASGETRERPVVEVTVHPLAVIEVFPKVRQVFQNDARFVEGLGVLNCASRRLLNDIRQSVLVVVKAFVRPPLGGVAALKPSECREHPLPELSRPSAVEDERLDRSTVLTGTARQEFRFADVEADRRWVVRLFRFRDGALNGDVKHPVRAVLGQAKLPNRYVAVEQVRPQLALGGVDTEWNPERRATSGLRDAPAELVRSVFGMVEVPPPVREPTGWSSANSEALYVSRSCGT